LDFFSQIIYIFFLKKIIGHTLEVPLEKGNDYWRGFIRPSI